MKTLLHLMAKDFRHKRSSLIFYWACLLLCTFWHWANRYLVLPSWVASSVFVFGFVTALGLVLALLNTWIHLDHPRSTDGFLETRPLTATMRWLPKLTLWVLLVFLPALAAIMIQMLLYQLDLEASYYFNVLLKSALIMAGSYGFSAFFVTLLKNERIVMLIGMPVVLFVIAWQGVNASRISIPIDDAQWIQAYDLKMSRLIVEWSLIGVAGFGFTAWRLARGTVRTLMIGVIILGMIGFTTRQFWPLSLINRPTEAVLNEPARASALQAKTQVTSPKFLHPIMGQKNPGHLYRTDPFLFHSPEEQAEWPRLVRNQLSDSSLRLSDGSKHPGSWTSVADPLEFLLSNPDQARRLSVKDSSIPTASIIHLLGLPPDLGIGVTAMETNFSSTMPPGTSVLHLQSNEPLPADKHLSVSGRLTYEWYRPEILASLPLEAGAVFTREGRSLRILSAAMRNGSLHLELRITSHFGWPGAPILDFDKDPNFQLFIANAARGEIALRQTSSGIEQSFSIAIKEAEVAAQYTILGSKKPLKLSELSWLQEGKLHIIRRQTIGRCELPYQTEISTTTVYTQP